MKQPILGGAVIGVLLTGIALAVVVTIYVQDRSRQSNSTTIISTTTTATTSTISTASTTTSTTSTSTTSSTSTISTTSTTTTATTTTTTQTTSTTTTSSTTVTTTTTVSTTTATTTSTTTAPPSTICVNGFTTTFYDNQFIYSISQLFAAGMMNNQFSIYIAYGNANVTTSTIWTASQSSTAQTSYLAIQLDRNLVVYTVSGNTVVWSLGLWNNGAGSPFCLQMLNSGNLIWTDTNGTLIWETNTAQIG